MASVLPKYSPTFLVQIDFGGVIFEDTADVEFEDTADVEWDSPSFQERYATRDFYDADGNYWKGTLIDFPDVSQELVDSYFGVEQSINVLLRFANPRDDPDDSWEEMVDGEELRGRWIKLQRHDPTDGTSFVMRGKIIRYLLGAEVEIEAEGRDDAILETLLPKKVVTTDEFTDTALDLGQAISLCLGNCRNVPLRNIQNNTDDNEYDYLIGYGTIESLDVDHANGKGIKRNGVLVATAEYTFYDGSQAMPYPGYAFLRFTVEQMDFSGGFHKLTADVKGLEMGGAAAQRNFARVVEQFLSDSTWGLEDKVDLNFRSNASLEDEDCKDISDWADQDQGVAVSSQVNNPLGGGLSTFEFDTNASSVPNDYARRAKNIGSIDALGNRIIVSIKTYFQTIGTLANEDCFQMSCYRSDWELYTMFASDGLYVFDGAAWNEVGTNLVIQNMWQVWTFDVDISAGVANAVCDVYLDGTLKATGVDCSRFGVLPDGQCYLIQYGYTTDDQISYVDWFKVGDKFEDGSFNAAAEHLDAIGNLYCDGPLTEQRKARDIINDLLLPARATIERNADEEWIMNVDVVGAVSALNLGENDGYYNNVTVVDRHVPSVSETLGTCYAHYALNAANNEKGFYELKAKASSFGTDLTLELPFVCEHATAKKVLSYQANRAVYGGRKVTLSPVGLEGRDLSRGDIITLDAPDHNIDSLQYKIESISRDVISRQLVCGTYNDRIYDDIPIDDPTDESVTGHVYKTPIIVSSAPSGGDFSLITDAIAALPEYGGEIIIKNGIYQQTGEIVYPNKDVNLRGESKGGVIIRNNPGDDLFVAHNRTKKFEFSTFTVQSQNVAAFSKMFKVYGTTAAQNPSDTTIDDIDIYAKGNSAVSDYGIYCFKGNGLIRINRCYVEDGYMLAVMSYAKAQVLENILQNVFYGIYGYNITNFNLSDNQVLDAIEQGITMNTGGTGICAKNIVRTKDGENTYFGILVSYVPSVVVSGNKVYYVNPKGTNVPEGITLYRSEGGICAENTVEIDADVAQIIRGIRAWYVNDYAFTGNTIKIDNVNTAQNHYGIHLSEESNRNNLAANNIDLVNNKAQDIGISLAATCDNNQGGDNITYRVGTSVQDLGAGNAVTAKDV